MAGTAGIFFLAIRDLESMENFYYCLSISDRYLVMLKMEITERP
jgi:hypothetical protein